MEKLDELAASSALVQSIMGLMVLGTVCYMYLQGMDVPEMLAGFVGLILGFYFGSKSVTEAVRRAALQPEPPC
jgi:hypothetical protein